MEIGQYLAVVRRYWWLVALTTLAALGFAVFLAYRGASAYKATVRVAVSTILPEAPAAPPPLSPNGLPSPPFYDPAYYAWLSSEYLADDLSEIVKSRAFAEDVSAALGEPVDPRSITEVLRTRKTHRILTITLTANEFARAQRLGDAVVHVLRTESPKYLAQLSALNGQIAVIDPAETQRGEGPVAVALEIALKTLLGLILGVALAFAGNYLDPTVRDAGEAERVLGLPILGEIPTDRPRGRGTTPLPAAVRGG